MNAPANVTSAYSAIVEALSRDLSKSTSEDPPAWLALAERLVSAAESLAAVPEIPVALPGVVATAHAMLGRTETHARADDAGTAGRWIGHVEQLVALTRRIAAVPRE